MSRFTLTNLLLLIAVTALVMLVANQRNQFLNLQRHTKALEKEVGHIASVDPTRINLRVLHMDIGDAWQYRVFIPEGCDYGFEYDFVVGSEPTFSSSQPLRLEPGQQTFSIHVAQDLLKPGDIPFDCFTISIGDQRVGLVFPRQQIRSLANSLGHYENQWNQLVASPAHNERIDLYRVGSRIPIFHVKDESDDPQLYQGKPAEISIRLVPLSDSKATDSSNSD